MNLNGDYVSDALAAQVGGIGIAPGGEHQLRLGTRDFRSDPRHGSQIRGQGYGEPEFGHSLGMMMFDYLGWKEAADLIDRGIVGALSKKQVTYDFARLMEGAVQVSTSRFGDTIIENMNA